MRKILDTIYAAALVGACLSMVAIAALVSVQVGGRILDWVLVGIGSSRLGIAVPSLAEIGGFLLVGAAFLALPSTLRAAGHVRVMFLLNILGPGAGRLITVLVLGVALGLASWAAWHASLQALDSWSFNTFSFGVVKVPLWIPQTVMSLGLVLFALALADDLVTTLLRHESAFRRAERERAEGNQ
jgi:TRAP-type C4-dicarboxylate transport system permease small subunit